MKKFIFILSFLFFLLIPNRFPVLMSEINFLPLEKVSFLKKESFLTLENKDLILFTPTKKINFVTGNFFFDFHESGYFVLYDKMGSSISLFYQEQLIKKWENRYNYPRIVFPYLFLFESDMQEVEIYALKSDFNTPLQTIKMQDMISAWNASPSGHFIIGDMSGEYVIYDNKNNKLHRDQIKKSNINYIKGVSIHDNGHFILTGSLYPEIVIKSHLQTLKKEYKTVPSTGRKRRIVKNFDYHAVIQTENGFLLIDQEMNIYTRDNGYILYDAMEWTSNKKHYFVTLAKKKERVEIIFFINYKPIYIFHLEAVYLPKAVKYQENTFILWHNGALKL